MLNRLFIVIGVLAILAIGAAFIVPGMINWGEYRDRMQAIAGEVLGADVEIVGDIEFSLLPQPQLRLGEIRVGAADDPVLTVASAEAQFSLLDFLRDRYLITRLVLQKPSFDASIDAGGRIDAGIVLAETVSTSNVTVASAEIVDGSMTVLDARSGDSFAATDIDGELRMDAVRGPFAFQGNGTYGDRRFAARVSTSVLDDNDQSQLTLFVQPEDQGFTLNADGLLSTGTAPGLSGTLTYRQAPPPAEVAEGEEEDIGRGDLVVTGKIEASAVRVLLSEYVIVPDENRSATRLTGAAEVTLGASPTFNAVISGGVLALPPRDATANQATMPYELVRLLAELPVPPVPAIPGTIGVDIAEVDLRAVALRDVRLDAKASGDTWTITNFVSRLPGNTTVRLDGELREVDGEPDFAGSVSVSSQRLDGLASLWRRPMDGNPLFNVPGALAAQLSLVGETLSVTDATVTVEDAVYPFDAEIGFEPATRHLNLQAALGDLTPAQSTRLMALLPDLRSDAQFGASFPKGKFDISAETMTLAGLTGRDLAANGTWEGGVLALESLRAGDFGGLSLDAKLTAFGTLDKPEFSGSADIGLARASAPIVNAMFEAIGTPEGLRSWLRGALPLDARVTLDAPTGQGEQGLRASGRAGAADLTLNATLGSGVARAFEDTIAIRLDLRSDDPAALTAQLGLGSVSLMPEGSPMTLIAIVDGNPANSFETTVRLEGGGEELGFSGNVVTTDIEAISGNGNLRVTMSDFAGLAERMGLGGIWVPSVSGNARVEFEGLERVRLTSIEASAGGQAFTGTLEWTQAGGTSAISGEIAAGRFDPQSLLALLAGPASTLRTGTAFWPDGPTAIGDVARRTSGRIAVTTPAMVAAGKDVVTDASFDLVWDATSIRVRDFAATMGMGKITAELSLCCAGPVSLKNVTARIALDGVPFGNVVPTPIADAISATIGAAARFEGSGDSLLSAMQAMTAEGSYTLTDISIARFDPTVFDAVSSLEAVIDMEPGALSTLIIDRLDDSAFAATGVSGEFTVAGGVLRSPNLAIVGTDAKLFGSTTIRLADLSLGGGFVMSPTRPSGPDGMLTEANARIVANFAGTLPAPERTLNVAGVVDTIMIRALEFEVARLEQLRAEDEARQRAAAAERARVAAEVAARRAAEEEAHRLEEEAAAEEAAVEVEPEPVPEPEESPQGAPLQPGFNLDLPPVF